METLILEGYKFRLYLEGEKKSNEYWTGSCGYEAKHRCYWFTGIGTITSKENGQKHFFKFATWDDDYGEGKPLENFVLACDKWYRGSYKKLPVIQEYMPVLAGWVCSNVLKQLEKAKEKCAEIPSVNFKQLPMETLSNLGFLQENESVSS